MKKGLSLILVSSLFLIICLSFVLGAECIKNPDGTPNMNGHSDQEEMQAACGDNVDNDCDGKIDCEDTWCQVPPKNTEFKNQKGRWFEADNTICKCTYNSKAKEYIKCCNYEANDIYSNSLSFPSCCGDGLVEIGEECDCGPTPSSSCADTCTSGCKTPDCEIVGVKWKDAMGKEITTANIGQTVKIEITTKNCVGKSKILKGVYISNVSKESGDFFGGVINKDILMYNWTAKTIGKDFVRDKIIAKVSIENISKYSNELVVGCWLKTVVAESECDPNSKAPVVQRIEAIAENCLAPEEMEFETVDDKGNFIKNNEIPIKDTFPVVNGKAEANPVFIEKIAKFVGLRENGKTSVRIRANLKGDSQSNAVVSEPIKSCTRDCNPPDTQGNCKQCIPSWNINVFSSRFLNPRGVSLKPDVYDKGQCRSCQPCKYTDKKGVVSVDYGPILLKKGTECYTGANEIGACDDKGNCIKSAGLCKQGATTTICVSSTLQYIYSCNDLGKWVLEQKKVSNCQDNLIGGPFSTARIDSATTTMGSFDLGMDIRDLIPFVGDYTLGIPPIMKAKEKVLRIGWIVNLRKDGYRGFVVSSLDKQFVRTPGNLPDCIDSETTKKV